MFREGRLSWVQILALPLIYLQRDHGMCFSLINFWSLGCKVKSTTLCNFMMPKWYNLGSHTMLGTC